MEDTMILTLRKPIKHGTVEFDHLDLCEPTVAQLRESEKQVGAVAQAAVLIAVNAKVPQAVADQLPQTEFQQACDFFGRFGAPEPTPPASATSSQN